MPAGIQLKTDLALKARYRLKHHEGPGQCCIYPLQVALALFSEFSFSNVLYVHVHLLGDALWLKWHSSPFHEHSKYCYKRSMFAPEI